ncbi:hypothetical protein BDV96DRAFT_599060 [Lophiotrema nucula]|uniref:RRM domain-containing protein n=1 Tax=Lophiotrema nucula TaxID=690887 RepID=A0A6A5ZD66_9PLEO|nr:hypothetical protein BDV96DRAFT_599060 [Lophiotrema nucula]
MSTNRALTSNNWRVKAAPGSESHASRRKIAMRSEEPKWKSGKFPRQKNAKDQSTAADNRIYVGNLPYLAKRSDLETFLKDKGLEVRNIDMSIDRFTGRNPSYCFVDLATVEAATSAVQGLNGANFLGRPLKIGPGQLKRDVPQQEPLISSRWVSSPPTDPATDTLPDLLPLHMLDPINEGRRLYVGGLPKPLDQHTSDQALRTLFQDSHVVAVSKVKSPHESTKDMPGNHYYAFVDLSSKEDMDAAIRNIDGKAMWGGVLRVNQSRSLPFKIFERARYGVDYSAQSE